MNKGLLPELLFGPQSIDIRSPFKTTKEVGDKVLLAASWWKIGRMA